MSIGETLKKKRTEKKLTVAEVASAVRINKKYIKAMEDDNFLLLPSHIYAKGFLKAYAEFLGLESKMLLSELLEYFKGVEDSKKQSQKVTTKKMNFNFDKQLLIYAGYFALALMIVIIVVMVFRFAAGRVKENKPVAVPQQIVKRVDAKRVDIKVQALDRSWIYVVVDNKETHSETLEPGDAIEFTGKVITVKAGNASGIKIFRDGKPYGTLGLSNEVVEQTYRVVE